MREIMSFRLKFGSYFSVINHESDDVSTAAAVDDFTGPGI